MDRVELKKYLYARVKGVISSGKPSQDELIKHFDEIVQELQKNKKYAHIHLDEEVARVAIKELCDDITGFGPLQALLDDPEVSEIMVNGIHNIYIEKKGKRALSGISFDDEEHLKYIVEKMLTPSGRRLDESLPFVDFAMPGGIRVNVAISPVTMEAAVITIRKFAYALKSLEDLVSLGTLDKRMASFLVSCVKGRLNIVFSGATGTGKTTLLAVLSSHIDNNERIIIIEDTPELDFRQRHVVRLLSRLANIAGKGKISISDLFINSLRMHPTRIILGELRGAEAMDYLQALNSGHKGSLAVLHASSPENALVRLELMALYAGINLPNWVIRGLIASGVDLIVQLEQFKDGSRKVTRISEVGELQKNNDIALKDIFAYEIESSSDEKVNGSFVAKGKPSFLGDLKKKGVEIDEAIFSK